MTNPKRMPWVIPEYCEGCTSCTVACPKRGLAMRAYSEDDLIPWLDDPDICTGCGLCADACGLGAIVMTEYVDDAAKRFREQLREVS